MRSFEAFVITASICAALITIWTIIDVSNKIPVLIIAGAIFLACVAIIGYLLLNPDTIRAHQTNSMLRLSSEMVDIMAGGMTPEAAQDVCALLLPNTAAIAVAITDRESILGYLGYLESDNPQGAAIRTNATHEAIKDGLTRVIYSAEEIGLPETSNMRSNMIKAAIIVPLRLGHEIKGTLKFYYKSSRRITETQKSIAQGFGELISTQIAAIEMEKQRELATSMELKMLQNQINPHFLFNTINTIASLIRTDPPKARILLREFAVFYRSTLENSQERIELEREIEQTQRYFMFEVARFGEDRLAMTVNIEGLEDMLVPPFLLQPLVENAVKHAMPAEGRLTVHIYSKIEDNDALVCVADDGIGMDDATRESIMHPHSQTGLGIAVKNVHDRMKGYYGLNAEMIVDSKLGTGTTITLRFPDIASNIINDADRDDVD